VKEVAEKIGTDPRTLRKFLRFEVKEAGGTIGEDSPGKGGRYSLEANKVNALSKRFASWNDNRKAAASEPEAEGDAELEEVSTDSELAVDLD
jgi:hypothetical protein